MEVDLSVIPEQSWFDLCQLAVKYATDEKSARKARNMKGGEADSAGAYPAADVKNRKEE